MELERDTAVEIAVSVGGVGVFIAAILAIGATFGDGRLSSQGGLALIATIVLFILLMSGIGYWLSAR